MLSGKIAKLEGELEALRKEKIEMREKIEQLQGKIDEMNRDKSLLQGNLGEEI